MKKLLCVISLMLCIFTAQANTSEYLLAARMTEYKYDLPKGLLETVCYVESNWKNVHGRHGEIGVCQIKPSTVRMTCPECAQQQSNLMYGTESEEVLEAQTALNKLGLYLGPLDGIFGPKTNKAVRTYQESQGLKVDGIIGPHTWYALFGTTQPYMSIVKQLKDPLQNIEYAGMHLRWLMDTMDTDDPSILSAAYNGGSGHPVVVYMLRIKNRMPRTAAVPEYFARL